MSYQPPPPLPYPPAPGYGYGYGWTPPPGPAPGLRYAGFWIRFVAYFIDSIVLFVPLGVLFAVAIAPTLGTVRCTIPNAVGSQSVTCTGLGAFTGSLGLIWLLALAVPAVYFVAMWSWQGQTLGQKVFGLHVVDARNGLRISVGRAIGRYIGVIVSSWVLYIGLIWVAFDAQKQGWHDKMASTYVVQRV